MEVVPSPTAPWKLSAVRVRLIEPGELARWEALMRAHHYLGLTAMVGKSLRYVGEVEGQWLALLGWASAALKCAARDAWIGWSPALQWQRIGLLANNTRFLLLPGPRVPNLASKLLAVHKTTGKRVFDEDARALLDLHDPSFEVFLLARPL